jgi:ABC-type transporter Mla MlaB component
MGFLGHGKLAVPVRPGEHACCHFTDADDRERLSVGFVRDGLRRGDKVLYLCDSDDLAPLISRLSRCDPGFDPAIARGQIEIRRARDTYLPEGQFEPERMLSLLRKEYDRALAEGYGGLRLTGEMPAALCDAPGREQLHVYEARLASDHRRHVELSASSCSILCQYDHGRFGPGILSEVVDAHQVDASPELATIGRKGVLAAARDRRRDALRLAGELDFDCSQTVSDVLDAHFHGPLRLDLADLTYVDVAGMRALRGRKGQRLTIIPASDAVRRLLTLLAWDTDPAIELVEVG